MAASSWLERIVFEELDGGLDGIERGAVVVKRVGGGGESFVDSGAVCGLGFRLHAGALDDSGTAVEDDGPLVGWRRGLGGLSKAGCGGEDECDEDSRDELHGEQLYNVAGRAAKQDSMRLPQAIQNGLG